MVSTPIFFEMCKLALGLTVCALQLILSVCGEDYRAGLESSVPEPLPCHRLTTTLKFFQVGQPIRIDHTQFLCGNKSSSLKKVPKTKWT